MDRVTVPGNEERRQEADVLPISNPESQDHLFPGLKLSSKMQSPGCLARETGILGLHHQACQAPSLARVQADCSLSLDSKKCQHWGAFKEVHVRAGDSAQ